MNYKEEVNKIIRDRKIWRKYTLDDNLIIRIDSCIEEINKEANGNKNKEGNDTKNKKEPLNKEVMNGLLYRLNIEKAKHNESDVVSVLVGGMANVIALLTLTVSSKIFTANIALIIMLIVSLGFIAYIIYWEMYIKPINNKIYLIESRIKKRIDEENMQ